jgi:hypothetical protein
MKKPKFVDGKHVGKFSNGGQTKFVSSWMTRLPLIKKEKTVTTTNVVKIYKITINLWNLLKWALIAMALYLIWSNTTIIFTFQ